MPLTAGARLGLYEILAPLGAGGMGEVYRARDGKLGRDVAIKILPDAVAQDPERLARFAREARVLASLNHPNIAVIYGVEENALVMELVEGASPQGPLAFDDAWSIASQMAAALEYAHEKGVIHRDLKPANIKVTPEGVVKLLDFGLAKAFSDAPDAPVSDPVNSPTVTMNATVAGVILGTAAYMAPEQAKGKRLDKRADIWAWGVVLYELLTGERLFQGDDAADTLAHVLTKEPDLVKAPPRVRNLLRRCLEKDPKQRLRDIGEARFLLADPGERAAPPRSWLSIAAIAVLAVVAAAASWIAYRATRPAELMPLARLDVDLGSSVTLGSITGTDAILSPRGDRLVYLSQGRLFTRRFDQPNASELAGTQGASAPFFSPDGQWIAFYAAGKLQKTSVDGGTPIPLCNAIYPAGGSWGEDGTIIASLSTLSALSRISSAGGPPTPVTKLDDGERTHRWPQILPGGKAVLFTASQTSATFDEAHIDVMSLGDGRRKTLVRGGTFGRYLPSGHLIYINQGTLFAVPFDLKKLELRGAPAPVLLGVRYNGADGSAQFDVSSAPAGHGTAIYRSGGAEAGGLLTVQWLDGTGKRQPLLARPDHYLFPRLSPDGQRLAVATSDVWIYEWPRDTMTRLTFGGGSVPVWSPDGRYIVFQAQDGMFWTRSDGAGNPQRLTQSSRQQFPFSFAPDGKHLAFYERNMESDFDIWMLPLEIDSSGLRAGKPEPFLQTQFSEWHPAFSPDGRWLAYDSNESGSYEVYVRAFPDKGGKWQVSNGGGLNPVWSRNGQELFFRAEDGRRILAATYAVKGDSFVPDKPRVWADNQFADLVYFPIYDLAPDGKRIAALMHAGTTDATQAPNQVVFLENFLDELRRRVPAGK